MKITFINTVLVGFLTGCLVASGMAVSRTSKHIQANEKTAEQWVDLNDPVAFHYGQKVEITAGFYKGRRGVIVDFDRDGTFEIEFDSSQERVSNWQISHASGLHPDSLTAIEPDRN